MNGNNNNLCSIGCLSYNHKDFLSQCVKSLWSQTYKKIEIIILDDGSVDGSRELIKNLQENSLVPMKVIFQKRSANIGKNLNTIIRNATGKYITFISSDDFLYPDALSSKIGLMEKDENLVFIANKKYSEIREKENKFTDKFFEGFISEKYDTPDDLLKMEFKYLNSFFIQGVVFRRSIIDAVGGFDEDLLGDDIVLRTKIFMYMIKKKYLTFKIFDFPSVYYRLHDSNLHGNIFRQIKLIVEWHKRYFSNKPFPDLLADWIAHAIKEYSSSKEFKKIFFILFLDRKILFSGFRIKVLNKMKLLNEMK